MKPYFDENGEMFCPRCKKTPGDFIPICDEHEKFPDQRGCMQCEDCLICDDCKPRTYWNK